MAEKPKSFDAFLNLMKDSGYEIKPGEHIAFKAEGQQRYTRLRSLGEGYSEDELRAAILGIKIHKPKGRKIYTRPSDKVYLLVDIQKKLQEGKGPGYERWAKVFNLKQMEQIINFLTENDITDYETLVEKTKAATDRYHELPQQIREIEKRMAEITELKKHIINYSKTKNVYAAYRQSGYSKKIYEEHSDDILLHQAAKKAFDNINSTKIPSVKNLEEALKEYKMKHSSTAKEFKLTKSKMKEAIVAKENSDRILKVIDL